MLRSTNNWQTKTQCEQHSKEPGWKPTLLNYGLQCPKDTTGCFILKRLRSIFGHLKKNHVPEGGYLEDTTFAFSKNNLTPES